MRAVTHNEKATEREITVAVGENQAVSGKEYAGNRRGVQGPCGSCAMLIPRKSAHGKDKCRWTGELLTAFAILLRHCDGYTVEVVCDD